MRIKTVSEPDISRDGNWVVYTVEENISKIDAVSNLWVVSYDGNISKQLTNDKKNSSFLPKWSPNGQWIAFLLDNDEAISLHLLNRKSGQIIKLTNSMYDVSDFAWSPDSQNIAFIASEANDKDSKNKPIVITRYFFKKDTEGYLGEKRTHLYRIVLQNKQIELLTPGPYDEWAPAWSPNGDYIAFISKRGVDPDRNYNSDVYAISNKPGSKPIQLTRFPGGAMDPDWESTPAWSHNNAQIAYLSFNNKSPIYAPTQLAVVGLTNHKEQIIAPIDRWFTKPKWSEDGKKIYALIETSRNTHLSEVDVASGMVRPLTKGERVDSEFSIGQERIVVVSSDDQHPPELFAVENTLRPLTHHNQKLLDEVIFRPLEDIEFKSFDGTLIEGLLLKPAHYKLGKQYPAFLNLHGGPVYQSSHEFNFDWQWLAAEGYTIIAPNPRGSSGKGYEFSNAINADWGNLDVKDALASVDYVIKKGIVDPNQLAVGGWSYGGMLTNYIIASTQRFKAAISGAGTGSILGNYGEDQYILDYETELGKPWLNTEIYLKLSYPLMKANKINTPTLFMCASLDFNMPCIGSEQLYQALKSLNIPTQLIIYPEQYHTLDRPDFQIDRLQRFKDWMDLYLKRLINK
ncbi:S9 family peptidase [Legionella parisiensis]|uniref:Prolyl tripeptidyl peptidase n=1 Tax=Legionella parisiensis TaxID=45071 RepID=A0A1E5JMN6_9GAMM|nr:S9 family peptidase [Legionella parisiensis]KTD41768.1 prolyl oligopeptidase [Legionella parisiensis]OEH45789.1 Prolyl tripeptidyl peptidase [Legionella parisiensis]STX75909.1 prolyl oligopeptidase [Legionella parisiensis]